MRHAGLPSVEQAVALYAAGWFPMDEAGAPEVPWYAVEHRAVFDLLCHPSVLYPNDPEFRVVELVCDLVKQAGDRATLVNLDTIASLTAAKAR